MSSTENKAIKNKVKRNSMRVIEFNNDWVSPDSEDMYYVTGWLSFFRKGTYFTVKSGLVNIEAVSFIKNTIFSTKSKNNLTIKNKNVELKFISKEVSNHCKQTVEYVESIKEDNSYKNAFYKGVIEASSIVLENDTIIFDCKLDKVKKALDAFGVKHSEVSNDFIILSSENSLELLSKLYKKNNVVKSSLYNFFSYIKNKYYTEAKLEYSADNNILDKTHFTDAGVDITALSLDEMVGDVFKMSTGVYVKIPVGFWGMLCPRSSIIKTGFIMANSFGVIDSSYRGELKISLQYNGTVEEGNNKLKELMPLKCAQLILIKQVIPDIIYLSKDLYKNVNNQTNRGINGHGSTDCEFDCISSNVSENSSTNNTEEKSTAIA